MATVNKKSKKNKAKLANLRTILTSPFDEKCSMLSESELSKLQEILQDSLRQGDKKPLAIATDLRIRLGLESTLRAINQDDVSCVFINLNLKPHFIVNLIKRNVEAKTSATVFAQKALDDFTNHLFGIKTAVLAFPADTSKLGTRLSKWLQKHAKPKNIEKSYDDKPIKVIKNKSKRKNKPSKEIETNEAAPKLPSPTMKKSPVMVSRRPFDADYVSLELGTEEDSSAMSVDDDAEDHLADALRKMANRVSMNDDSPQTAKEEQPCSVTETKLDSDSTDNSEVDDFLPANYRPLVLQRINVNPNKKPKKKRNKKK